MPRPDYPFDTLHAPVIYGDIFDFPLTLDEIHRFCALRLTKPELEKEIESSPEFQRFIARDNGYFFLKGRDDLVEIRKKRERESEEVWNTADRVVNFLKYIPCIKGILVTGSLAVNNARRKDDIDFLVFVSPHRLWSVFFVLGMLQRIFSRKYFCSNYYKSIDHLELMRESYFLARESIQSRPVFGEAFCKRFYEKNQWLFDWLPNADREEEAKFNDARIVNRKGVLRWLTGALEWVMGTWVGDVAEAGFRKLLQHRLHVHYGKHGSSVPEDILHNAMNGVELKFHGLDHENWIIGEMKKRLDKLSPQSESKT